MHPPGRAPFFDTKEGLSFVRDPIHSYISITTPSRASGKELTQAAATELDLISSPWIQRLRRIRQTQAAYTVFPGLEHSRFQHVLGVMHLAGKMARRWYGQMIERLRIKGQRTLLKEMPEVAYVEEVFRLAGLLHDVGHGPFSHSLDRAFRRVFPEAEINHEVISTLIIEREVASIIRGIKRSPHGEFSEPIDPGIITYLINPKRDKYNQRKYLWLRILRPIISGLMDADALDYLSRDAYHGGLLEYGLLDIDRFIKNTFLVYTGDPGSTGLYLHKNSLMALEFLLLSRFQMYRSCYYHKSVRAFELKAEELLAELIRVLKFPDPRKHRREFLEQYFHFDEYWLFAQAQPWQKSKNPRMSRLGKELERFANRDHGLFLAHDVDFTIRDYVAAELIEYKKDRYQKYLEELLEKVKSASAQEVDIIGLTKRDRSFLRNLTPNDLKRLVHYDTPFLDVRRGVNPLRISANIRIYDGQNPNVFDEIGIREIINNLPMLYLPLRIYVGDKQLQAIIGKVLRFVDQRKVEQDSSY